MKMEDIILSEISQTIKDKSCVLTCVRIGVFLAISVNKDVTVISDFSPPCELLSPKGTLEGEEYPGSSSLQDCSHAYSEPPGSSGCHTHTHTHTHTKHWPRIAKVHTKGTISVSGLLPLPMHRRVLNS